jgi:quercetin dioxygenase-like cupin family protein
MITYNRDAKTAFPLPGLTRKTLAVGQSMMICEFTFDANVEIPSHTHPHEQVGYLAKGRVKMIIDGKEFELKQGDSYYAASNVEIPSHTHPHEQVGYLAKGRVKMIIDGKEFELKQGDSYYAASNVPHGALTLEPSVIVDTFSPPREDYL